MEFLINDYAKDDSIKKNISLNIKNYSEKDLISLINKERTFDNIDINDLKLLNNNIFKRMSNEAINNFTQEGI